MGFVLFAVFLLCRAEGDQPSIVIDNHPERGIPPEAKAQKVEKQFGARSFREMTQGKIKTVRIRYFNRKTWATEEQARAYVAGFLAQKSNETFGFQVWSQEVLEPEIECLVDFTDDYRQKLLGQGKPCREGRLLIWNTESCFRDATGRWWFVSAFDYFHRAHPKGDRKLSKGTKEK